MEDAEDVARRLPVAYSQGYVYMSDIRDPEGSLPETGCSIVGQTEMTERESADLGDDRTILSHRSILLDDATDQVPQHSG